MSASVNFVAPGQQRYLRACMVCRTARPIPSRCEIYYPGGVTMMADEERFRDEGCPNCEDFLHLAGSQDQIESCTSQVFEGLVTLADPSKSWVAKWQRLDGYVPGVYAIKVSGQLPDEIRSALEDEYRIQYIPRDGTEAEAE
ncbi:Transcription initiation Spt4-like protein [Cordyceps fumosorosea ARSEF 2679]|uniref:Transcription elongation factor SPT4 n=1 Tax=Cordyceps fumosorosea (strain ARSEF 2679) TaxID=1081104 RepID=A0A168CN90_CORFA|nr:Transcription initiation Spt4-like protein [Cordyceps fumosorosea ARSEF 2679]OAA71586.1 Transcription initiation Spt4-like protein [Cordyceps fumosorosea ARSEF 2679]